MTDPAQQPQPGWYPIAPGSAELRWWDGTQWTEHRHIQQPGAYGQSTPLVAPEGTRPSTIWVWLMVATPILSLIGLLQFDIRSYLKTVIDMSQSSSGTLTTTQLFTPSYLVLVGLSFVTFVLTVVFAALDYYALRRRGIPRPFHWAWSILETGAVYIIGRSVIVRRRTGRGLAPLWVWIAVIVIISVVAIALVFSAFADLAPQFERLSGS